jgi:hypothetical protein
MLLSLPNCYMKLQPIDIELVSIDIDTELPPVDVVLYLLNCHIKRAPIDINMEQQPTYINMELPPIETLLSLLSCDIELLPRDMLLSLNCCIRLPPIDMGLPPINMLLSSLNCETWRAKCCLTTS